MSESNQPLVRTEYAAAQAAIGDLSRAGLLTPAQAALARVRAFWDAERNAAENEDIDLDAQVRDTMKKVIPGADAN